MEQNHFAHGASAGAAADEHASLSHNHSEAADRGAGPDEHAFASQAEEDSYWTGVADGIRQLGGIVPPRLAARAAKGQLLAAWHGDAPPDPGDNLAFPPVPVAHRHDGWTPQKQRAFVEALADSGIIRHAAATVGMTEQSVNRLRRRADARAFDRACDRALRLGARRLHSIAFERAIEGTIKRHYFHGELKGEERVYDNRLLIALLARLPDPLAPDPEAEAVADNWEPWMDAVEQGLDAPEPSEPAANDAACPDDGGETEPAEGTVWTDDGATLTDCPPPADFDGYQDGAFRSRGYQRALSAAEERYWLAEGRDAAFGTEEWGGPVWYLGRSTFFPWGSEPSSLPETSRRAEDEPGDAGGGVGT